MYGTEPVLDPAHRCGVDKGSEDSEGFGVIELSVDKLWDGRGTYPDLDPVSKLNQPRGLALPTKSSSILMYI